MTGFKWKEEFVPFEVFLAVNEIQLALKNYNDLFMLDPDDDHHKLHIFDVDGQVCICTNYEDGIAATFFYDKVWYYRDPATGNDREVPGQKKEVVANWLCYFTG